MNWYMSISDIGECINISVETGKQKFEDDCRNPGKCLKKQRT